MPALLKQSTSLYSKYGLAALDETGELKDFFDSYKELEAEIIRLSDYTLIGTGDEPIDILKQLKTELGFLRAT